MKTFLADLCAVNSSPPQCPLLQSGFALVFKGSQQEWTAEPFAEQVVKAVAECRARGRNKHIREKAALEHLFASARY